MDSYLLWAPSAHFRAAGSCVLTERARASLQNKAADTRADKQAPSIVADRLRQQRATYSPGLMGRQDEKCTQVCWAAPANERERIWNRFKQMSVPFSFKTFHYDDKSPMIFK